MEVIGKVHGCEMIQFIVIKVLTLPFEVIGLGKVRISHQLWYGQFFQSKSNPNHSENEKMISKNTEKLTDKNIEKPMKKTLRNRHTTCNFMKIVACVHKLCFV